MIVHFADGKATGDGFALFDNEQELTQVLMQLNKSMIGSRYVELYKSSLKEFEMVRDLGHNIMYLIASMLLAQCVHSYNRWMMCFY